MTTGIPELAKTVKLPTKNTVLAQVQISRSSTVLPTKSKRNTLTLWYIPLHISKRKKHPRASKQETTYTFRYVRFRSASPILYPIPHPYRKTLTNGLRSVTYLTYGTTPQTILRELHLSPTSDMRFLQEIFSSSLKQRKGCF